MLAFSALLPASASAKTAPCIPGKSSPRCQVWDMKVDLVADGDTIHGTVGGKKAEVRFIGLNAMELYTYSHTASKRRGACMGVPAANFADKLIGKHVRLAAQRASSRSGHRIRRSVFVKKGGRWVDVALAELKAGYALFLPNGDEWAHNLEYQTAAAEARAAGRNLWDPNACGGPQPEAVLSVTANWDADGGDEQNINNEYIEVRNTGATPVDLGGWHVRDSWLNWWKGSKSSHTPGYKFAPGTSLAPLSAIRIHVGCGSDESTDVYWCQKSSAFENVTYDKTHIGDGAYLFDTKGSLRASFLYPCLVQCSNPLKGQVRLDPHPSRPESIGIVNTGNTDVDLADTVLKLRNRGKAGQYVFGNVFSFGTIVAASDRLNWRADADNRFSDNGGVVELRTLDDQLIDCAAWGFGRC
jgi:endonuclease YncB( thermonuclease family)